MKAIEKIIFNELASRRAVALPGVGVLGVSRRAAQTDGREVKAPVNQVVFSVGTGADVPSVTTIMESLGMEPSQSAKVYNEWLGSVRAGDGVAIKGVGTLSRGVFTPSLELEQILNPLRSECPPPAPEPVQTPVQHTPVHHAAAHRPTHHSVHHAAPEPYCEPEPMMRPVPETPKYEQRYEPKYEQRYEPRYEEPAKTDIYNDDPFYREAPVYAESPRQTSQNHSNPERGQAWWEEDGDGRDDRESRRSTFTNILLIIAIALLAALLGMTLFNSCRGGFDRMGDRVEMWKERAGRGQNMDVTEHSGGVVEQERAVEVPETDSATVPAAAAVAADVAKYHLVVGSFDNPDKAQELVDYYERAFPNLTIETVDNGRGRRLVSVYQSDNRGEVYNRFYRIAEQTGNWEMWVFERE